MTIFIIEPGDEIEFTDDQEIAVRAYQSQFKLKNPGMSVKPIRDNILKVVFKKGQKLYCKSAELRTVVSNNGSWYYFNFEGLDIMIEPSELNKVTNCTVSKYSDRILITFKLPSSRITVTETSRVPSPDQYLDLEYSVNGVSKKIKDFFVYPSTTVSSNKDNSEYFVRDNDISYYSLRSLKVSNGSQLSIVQNEIIKRTILKAENLKRQECRFK